MALLVLEGITKRFGGLVANNHISFTVQPGEILGLIGPNGAGKSTLFDVITGYYRPEAGEIRFDTRRLVGLRPDQVNRLGIARTFQKLRPFHGMTVLENVMVGVMQHEPDPAAARREALRYSRSWSWRTRATAMLATSASESGSDWRWPGPWPPVRACSSWMR